MTAHDHAKRVDGCYRCELNQDELGIADPYVEVADANPERRNNGCQIYKRGADEAA